MRILNLKQFRALPEGVVFMKYTPSFFGSLQEKGETWGSDFISAELTDNINCGSSEELDLILDKAEKDSNYSITMDLECGGRDGFFEDEQLFAVYEQIDIDNLIEKLKTCKGL